MDTNQQTPDGTGATLRDPGETAGPWWKWWPALLPLLTFPLVYNAERLGLEKVFGYFCKPVQETTARVVLPLAILFAGARYAIGRRRLDLIVCLLATAFFCREWHFPGTHKGVYIAVALIGALALAWRKRIWPQFHNTKKGRWLTMAAIGYAVAMVIQRGGLKFLPEDDRLRHAFEEVSENIAHVMLVVAALVGPLGRRKKNVAGEQGSASDAG